MKLRKKISIFFNIIILIVAIIAIVKLWHIYKINDFKEFTKAEFESGISEFTRDDKVKYSNAYSYKIYSSDYNDALIYKNIQVDRNTPYKVSAMVKYENVENREELSEGGVNIAIMDTLEKSESYVGSSEWKRISFEFNSKERDNINIAFRLGSYDDNSKGTVWFTNFKIEKGNKIDNSNWHCAFFIMKNINVDVKNDRVRTNVRLALKDDEVALLRDNMERFKQSIKELSREYDDSNL